jgi:hypothetical protein
MHAIRRERHWKSASSDEHGIGMQTVLVSHDQPFRRRAVRRFPFSWRSSAENIGILS